MCALHNATSRAACPSLANLQCLSGFVGLRGGLGLLWAGLGWAGLGWPREDVHVLSGCCRNVRATQCLASALDAPQFVAWPKSQISSDFCFSHFSIPFWQLPTHASWPKVSALDTIVQGVVPLWVCVCATLCMCECARVCETVTNCLRAV